MAGNLVIDTLTTGTGSSVSSATLVNGSAKAWVNFSGINGSIRSSFNVSSVTRNGIGDYTVNFTSALADANYSTATMTNGQPTNAVFAAVMSVSYNGALTAMTPSTCRLTVGNSGSNYDMTMVSFVAYR